MTTISPICGDILALSLDGKSTPSLKLSLPPYVTGSHSLGWGLGWYPNDDSLAVVMKDPSVSGEQIFIDTVTDWSKFRSTVFFCKVCGASEGYSYTQTQPFSRSFAGRDWLFTHSGNLDKKKLEELHGIKSRLLEPLGNTDSELIFCNLLSLIQEGSARKISDIDPTIIDSWLQRFDSLGSADMYFTDGDSVVCYHGSHSNKTMFYTRIQPPSNRDVYFSDLVEFSLNDPRDTYRTAMIVSSFQFNNQVNWQQMQPKQMLIMRRGKIIWNNIPEFSQSIETKPFTQKQPQQKIISPLSSEVQAEQAQAVVLNVRAKTKTSEGKTLSYRIYEIAHTTHYEYTESVEHSTHTLRLQPTEDPVQEVVTSQLTISSPAEEIQYEDVFGNQAIHFIIHQPYIKLTIEAISRIKIYAVAPDDHSFSRRQTSIPLIWMPWQRQMMMPYLLPPELPESELTELTEYAMSFVERNDYHLLKTVEDINISIYRDFKYVSGSTSINTTAFEVYTSRQGVCQDFANLFICLTRLLGIPARYRMGYIYTGAKYANQIQSDASHAWPEVYLPYVGWRGFDPTNGCTVNQDHIRVACGRNYRDATPTSGTIYKGGGTETLKIDVKIIKIEE